MPNVSHRGKFTYPVALLPPPPPPPPPPPIVPPATAPVWMLTPSTSLATVPAVDLSNAVVLTPASYASMTAMFAANATKAQYLFGPGDYTSWGPMLLTSKAGGSVGAPKVVRYYNPGVDDDKHPVDRSNEALIDGIQPSGTATTYWAFQGLTWRHPSVVTMVYGGAHDIVFDRCLAELCVIYSLRIRETTACTVQNCVLRNMGNTTGTPPTGVGDSTGIQVGSIDASVTGVRILDNQIYNCGDCIQSTDGPSMWKPVEMFIEGNDLYHDSTYYIGTTNTEWLENGIDMKAGSDNPRGIEICNNRIWGMRHNAGPTAIGEAIVVQRFCRNVYIHDNFIMDAPVGVRDNDWSVSTLDSLMTYTADAATDTLTATATHHLTAGAGPFVLTTTGTTPGGTDTTTQYWSIIVSGTAIKLATSRANALAGTAVDLTSAGAGTNKWRIDPNAPRTLEFLNNDVCDIRDYATNDKGSALRPLTANSTYSGNYISRVSYEFDKSPTTYHSNITITGNIESEIGATQRPELQVPALPYTPALNTRLGTPAAGYEGVQRKRWVGTEIVSRAKPWTP